MLIKWTPEVNFVSILWAVFLVCTDILLPKNYKAAQNIFVQKATWNVDKIDTWLTRPATSSSRILGEDESFSG